MSDNTDKDGVHVHMCVSVISTSLRLIRVMMD